MDIRFASFAHSKGAFADAAQSSPSVPPLLGFAVDVTDGEIKFRGTLNFIYVIRPLLNRNALTLADPSLQLCPPNGLKSLQFVIRR
jgi:hypothetical protein